MTRKDGPNREQVYFVSFTDGPIKIGKAVNMRSRLNTLQCCSPFELEVLGLVYGSRGHEKLIHSMFKKFRIRGEWYARAPEVLDYIRAWGVPWAPEPAKRWPSSPKNEALLKQDLANFFAGRLPAQIEYRRQLNERGAAQLK